MLCTGALQMETKVPDISPCCFAILIITKKQKTKHNQEARMQKFYFYNYAQATFFTFISFPLPALPPLITMHSVIWSHGLSEDLSTRQSRSGSWLKIRGNVDYWIHVTGLTECSKQWSSSKESFLQSAGANVSVQSPLVRAHNTCRGHCVADPRDQDKWG